MIKTILVPTDFSENALCAAQYACKLAQKRNYIIELFHCYTTASTSFSVDDDSATLKADILIIELKEQLLKEFGDLQIRTTCVSGLIDQVIPALTAEQTYTMIVMGTTGAGQGKSILWGSNTSSIVSKSTVPVLAIPAGYNSFKFNHVAILTNFQPEELETLASYIQTVHPISNLEVIHVFRDVSKQSSVENDLQSWSFNISEINGVDQVKVISKSIESDDKALDTVPEVIQHIINKENYDMVLITKSRKSFFKRLFSTSVSKKIALHLNRPTYFDNN